MMEKVLHEQTNKNIPIATTNLPIEGNHCSIKTSLIRLPFKMWRVNIDIECTSFSCDTMISSTKVVLKLISDAGKYLFCEKSIRGGISYISKRYSKPNSKYSKCNDPKQKLKHVI